MNNTIGRQNKTAGAILFLSTCLLFSCAYIKTISEPVNQDPKIYSLLCAGDILIADKALRYIDRFGPEYPFMKIRDYTRSFDYFFANLETPVTSRGVEYIEKTYRFRLDRYQALSLKEPGLSAVSIANNHIMDYGEGGLEDTIDFLNSVGIAHSGAGRTAAEARIPAEIMFGANRLYILSYNDYPPADFFARHDKAGCAGMNLDEIKSDISKYKRTGAAVMVSLHWGDERTEIPRKDQIASARAIIDSGADMIIGHHPHWAQGIEIYKGKPVIYSLGNFYSGFTYRSDRDNIMAAFYFVNGSLKRLEIIPVAGLRMNPAYQPYVLTGIRAHAVLKQIRRLSKKNGTTFEIIDGRGVVDF